MNGNVLSKRPHVDRRTRMVLEAIPVQPEEIKLCILLKQYGMANTKLLPPSAPIYQSDDNMVAYISQECKDRFLEELDERGVFE